MPYRVCKSFEVESGHMLSKHPDRCRFPHGHSRRIELVLSADRLDANDMVVDFKWVKLTVQAFIDQFDHALCINAADPARAALQSFDQRVVVFEEGDPTTERMAERVFKFVRDQLAAGQPITTRDGVTYRLSQPIKLERVRVWETSSSWAEYATD